MADGSHVESERLLAAYYDAECHDRVGRGVTGMRLAKRNEAVERLFTQGSRPLLDLGMGPARDSFDLAAAGFGVVGIDLSLESCRYGNREAVLPVNASAVNLPFARDAFSDAWSMSVLMHLEDSAVQQALAEICRVVVAGGHVALATWGGDDVVLYQDNDYASPRPFNLRSNDRWRSLVDRHVGPVVEFETGHHDVQAGWWYQWCVSRVE